MTETTNYGLKLMERADSGNWITGGLNGNTTKIDEVMKQLSGQLTDANGLIAGLQNQLDTTNGSLVAQGGQITELGNLISGANGNIATLTQAVEDLQTKQPTLDEVAEVVGECDNSNVCGAIRFMKLGKVIFIEMLVGITKTATITDPVRIKFNYPNDKYKPTRLLNFDNLPFSLTLKQLDDTSATWLCVDESIKIFEAESKLLVEFSPSKATTNIGIFFDNDYNTNKKEYRVYHKEFLYVA